MTGALDLQARDGHSPEVPLENGAQGEGAPEQDTRGGVVSGEVALQAVVPAKTTSAPEDTGAEDMADSGVLTSYEYKPILQNHGIRVLVLEGATRNEDEPLVCSLRHCDLDDVTDFEAISYVWGSSDKTHTITCDDRPLAITKNLHTVLKQTRLRDQQRTLWADAICINQGDNKEKGRQVTMMSRIYEDASKVVICLGPDESGNAETIAGLVSEVSQWILVTIESTDGSRESFPWIDNSKWPYSDRRWAALGFLLFQPWFFRGWVVQEAGLAEDALILWGDTVMKWSDLLLVWLWVRVKTTIGSETRTYMATLHLTNYIDKHPKAMTLTSSAYNAGLLETLDLGRGLNLTDKRDRIYAFLGLPGAADVRHGLEVNYDLSYPQVYFEFAVWYINTIKDLELLHYIDHDDDALSAVVPSWVPYWDIAKMKARIPYPEDEPIISASEEAANKPLAAIQGSKLRVRGCLFDRIALMSQVMDWKTTIEDVVELWGWFEKRTTYSVYRTAPLLLFLAHAIRLGVLLTGTDSSMSWAHVAAYILRLQNGKPLPSHPSFDIFRLALTNHNGDATVAHEWIKTCFTGRRLVITVKK